MHLFKSQKENKANSLKPEPQHCFPGAHKALQNNCSQLSLTLMQVKGAHPHGNMPAAKQRASYSLL